MLDNRKVSSTLFSKIWSILSPNYLWLLRASPKLQTVLGQQEKLQVRFHLAGRGWERLKTLSNLAIFYFIIFII